MRRKAKLNITQAPYKIREGDLLCVFAVDEVVVPGIVKSSHIEEDLQQIAISSVEDVKLKALRDEAKLKKQQLQEGGTNSEKGKAKSKLKQKPRREQALVIHSTYDEDEEEG